MQITVDRPDELAPSLEPSHPDLSRSALEALGIEGCRSGSLNAGRAAKMLGVSRYQMDGILKRAGVYDMTAIRLRI